MSKSSTPQLSEIAAAPVIRGLPDAPFCNRSQVLAAYGGKSVSWLYEGMAEGRIPRPVKIGPNSVAWVTEEIRRDIASKIAAGPVLIQPRARRRKQPVSSAPEAA